MPFTFTHPLAVLPFRRWCPHRLHFAALIIGSLTPDAGYYVQQFQIARFAHTTQGTIIVCLPTGLLLLAAFYVLRQPLCYLLPQPHRTPLAALARTRPTFNPRFCLTAAVSLLLGAWTHTIWDSFTHDGAWFVERIAALRAPLVVIGNMELPGYYLLQQLSTFGGAAALALTYYFWLRRQRSTTALPSSGLSDRQRYAILALIATVSLAVAIPLAAQWASQYQGVVAFRVLVFRTAIYGIAAFVPLLLAAALLAYAVRPKE